MKIEEFQQNRFVRNFINDKWLIFASAGILMLFAIGYVAFAYKPAYKAEAKLWIKDTSTASYLSTNRDEPGYLSSLTSAGNPVMTQSEILSSREMENYLADFVLQEEAKENQGKVSNTDKPNTKKIIKVKTEPNTDILTVSLNWENPVMAQRMLTAAVKKLDDTNLAINREIYTKKSKYLAQQLDDISSKLSAARERIKQFQSGNLSVDVDTQTQELIRLRSQLVAQMETTTASRNNSAGNARSLQGQLSLSPKAALNAVALGSGNENLTKMRTDLSALKQQYAHDSIKEAPTNPHLIALKSQIDTLEAQVNQEISQTVGKSGGNGPRIFDSVRSQLVQDLASSNAKSNGLGAEAASLSAAINRVDAALKTIPQRKFTLSSLLEEEKALAQAYDELRKKQIEARIKEAETPSNVFVVDSASLPDKPSFPTGAHIVLLSTLLGLGAGLGLSILKTYSNDLCEGSESVKEATRSKVLGVVPWHQESVAGRDGDMFVMNDIACKNIISNLRIESSKNAAQVITFTSSSLDKPKTGGAYHLAQCMERVGQTVAYIEADFRPSNLLNAVVDPSAGFELTDMILATDLKLRKGQPVYAEEVLSGLMRDVNGIHLAMNRQNVAHPYDYFASKGFRHIVSILKEQFDWVFINTPSASIAPEFMPIASISEGVVVFVDKNATFRTLRKITDKVSQTQTPLLGTIVREQNGKLEWEHEVYSNWRGPHQGGSGGSLVGATSGSSAQKKRVEFMGAKIDPLTMQETLARISEMIDNRQKVQHVVVNVAKLMTMRRDSRLRKIVNDSDIVNADGAGVVIGAKFLGINIPERVAGIDLMQQLVALSSQKNYRLFFLGAEEDIVRDVVTHYKRLYPNLQISGYRNGFFKAEEGRSVAEKIHATKADILFVAISSPMKEKFISDYKELMDVPFVMGVGGSFDVVAGKVKRAPVWMQNAGLEWFYRFSQEPGRMWKRYLVTNFQFGMALAGQAVSIKLRPVNG